MSHYWLQQIEDLRQRIQAEGVEDPISYKTSPGGGESPKWKLVNGRTIQGSVALVHYLQGHLDALIQTKEHL